VAESLGDAIEDRTPEAPTGARRFAFSVGRFLALVSLVGIVSASLFMACDALGYVSLGTLWAGGGLGALLATLGMLGIPVSFVLPVMLGQWSLGHRGAQWRGTAAGVGAGLMAGVVAYAAIPAVVWLDSLVTERALDSGIFGLPAAAAYVAYGAVLAVGLLWMVSGGRLRDARVRWALVAIAGSLALLVVSSSYLTGLLERVHDLYDQSDTESVPLTGQYGEPLGDIGPNGLEMAIGGYPFVILPYAIGASLGIMLVRKRRAAPA
jgi:hypothetical protein